MRLDIAAIRELRPENDIRYFPSVGSTMTEAAQLVEAGAPHGTVVIADEQLAGIGRLGRTWISEQDAGIYASIVLRLPLSPAELPLSSLLVGLATAEAIDKCTHLATDLRWPNDVLIGEQKVCGVLTQLHENCIVAGVGINVNNTSFPAGLRTPATSLLLAMGGRPQSREKLIGQLLESVDTFCKLLIEKGPEAILRAFTAASTYVIGRRVVAEENGVRGVTAGLDAQGFLLLSPDGGAMQRISSGGVRADGGAIA